MKSNEYRSKTIDKMLGGTNYTPPATVWMALYTVAPTEAGGGTECSGGSYARVSITNDATAFPAASDGEKANGTAITFPTATAPWGTVVAWGLHQHATNDDLVVWGLLDDPEVVEDTDTKSFGVGTLQFSEQ